MQVLTSEEMRRADQRSADEFGVPLWALMERAGEAVARFVLRQYPAAERVLALCGKGNNGGDGLVAARLLAGEGVGVRVLLLGRKQDLQGEPRRALEQMVEAVGEESVEELTTPEAIDVYAEAFAEADVLLDAVVGTGFQPPLRELAARLRDKVNRLEVPVVSVDLPSGWDADTTTQGAEGDNAALTADATTLRAAFRSDAVVTFTAPKPAHVLGHLTPGKTFGPVVVAQIGSPEAAVQSELRLCWTGSAKKRTEQARPINSNKGRFGHVLLVGGSVGKAGAPSMASLAALRGGAGLVTAAVPASLLNTVALVTPELMTRALEEGPDGAAALRSVQGDALASLLKGISVLAVGPGLSTSGEAPEVVRQLLAGTSLPTVLDADALNVLAEDLQPLTQATGKATGEVKRVVVLTPHPGEMARLAHCSVAEVEADRLGLARRFVAEHGVTLVLKGWRTLVVHPDGRAAVNTTGNPGMAKGGSGDILTGIVAAMLAQYGDDAASAVEAAVYLHGLAADLAVGGRDGHDEHTLLATDTIAHLSAAYRFKTRDEDGFDWICGAPSRVAVEEA